MMTCTDCHTNDQNSATQAKGPHGATADWIIDPAYPTDWRTTYLTGTISGMDNTTNICAKCHTNLAFVLLFTWSIRNLNFRAAMMAPAGNARAGRLRFIGTSKSPAAAAKS